MTKVVRNPFPYPFIKEEEDLAEPLSLPGYEYDWATTVSPHHRLYLHQTLASIRQNRKLKHPHAPKDSLDYVLASVYNHQLHSDADKAFVCLQRETAGLPGYRLFKNKRTVLLKRPARDLYLDEDSGHLPEDPRRLPNTKWLGLRHAGLAERLSPFSVKLGISSNHAPQSNAGYSRKVDGSFFSS